MKKGDFQGSPTRRIKGPISPTKSIDPKLGAPRKTAGVRNLPKIEKKASNGRAKAKKSATIADGAEKNDIKPAPLASLESRKSSDYDQQASARRELEDLEEDGE